MNKYYQLIVPDEYTETFSFVEGEKDYSKFVTEGVVDSIEVPAYLIVKNPYTEQEVQDMGAQEISQDEFDAYFRRIGTSPPTKPPRP